MSTDQRLWCRYSDDGELKGVIGPCFENQDASKTTSALADSQRRLKTQALKRPSVRVVNPCRKA